MIELLTKYFDRPIVSKKTDRHNRQIAYELLAKHTNSSEDFLKLWPHDKHYFFYKDSFIAYGEAYGIALILDGAAGNEHSCAELREAFYRFCRKQHWHIAVLHASKREQEAWSVLGLKSTFMGSEARVNIKHFCEQTVHDKHFRYTHNKAVKDKLEVKELTQPLTKDHLHQLKTVSNEWLGSGRREYRFMMGPFSKAYLMQCRIFVVYQDGKMVAYTNLLPSFNQQDFSIDHMRFKKGTSPAVMHFLLMSVILSLQKDNARTLNLGLAPLSQIEDNTERVTKALLLSVRYLGSRRYSFAGLEQFKNKFDPDWEPTYLVHPALKHMPMVGPAINKLTTYK